MRRSLKGRSIILTGASQGIGRALALQLAQAGARLTLAARSAEKLEALARSCPEPENTLVCATDVASPDACEQLVARAAERFGDVDVLINNAGISMSVPFEDVEDLSIFERLMQVNYLGTVYCTYHALGHLKRSRGLLVAISSLQGKTGFPRSTGYAASKHAVQGFCDSLRIELAPSGVGVLVVSPGAVATDIHTKKLDATGDMNDRGAQPADHKMMPVDECARQIVRAIRRRRRELVMTTGGKLATWLKPFAPGFVDQHIAAAVEDFYEAP